MTPARLEEPQRMNKLAIASLILSTTVLVVYLVWPAAAGIICIRYHSPRFMEALSTLVSLGIAFGVGRLGGTTILFYLGLLSILTSLSGLVTGIVSMVQIKRNHGIESGSRVAMAGIGFAIPGIILELLFVANLAFFWFIQGIPM